MRRKFTIEPYSMELVFVWNATPEYVSKLILREYNIAASGMTDEYDGLSLDLGLSSYLIYIPNAKADISTYVTCVHEACHIAQWILKKVNVKEEESLCYCVDSISNKLMTAIESRAQLLALRKHSTSKA